MKNLSRNNRDNLKLERNFKEYRTILSNYKEIFVSFHATETVKLAGRKRVTYSRLRDHILVMLTIRNGQRAGCPSRFKIHELEHAVKYNDKYTINASDHKTAARYDDAYLHLNSELYELCLILLDMRKRQEPNDSPEDYLFVDIT